MLQDEEFVQGFIEEARVHIQTVEEELLNMNPDEINEESINNIFRAVHSIKGTSSFFNFNNIVKLSHTMENIFGEIRSGNMTLSADMIDILLEANDCLKLMIEDVRESDNFDISSTLEVLSAINNSEGMTGPTATEKSKASIAFGWNEHQINGNQRQYIENEISRGCKVYALTRSYKGSLSEIQTQIFEILKEIKSFGNIIDCHMDADKIAVRDNNEISEINIDILFTTVLEMDILPETITEPSKNIFELYFEQTKDEKAEEQTEEKSIKQESILPNTAEKDNAAAASNKQFTNTAEDSIRVNVTLLNSLLNTASEMVLARNQLLRTTEKYRKTINGIEPILANIDHLTSGLQEKVMQTRMQPISNVFNKFPRIVRDISKKLDKDIRLELEGTEVELDKSIIEALGDPMTHLVRNAIDHGIEHPNERASAGKLRTGVVKLKAYHESGYVNIDIIDDGKGIDIERIKAKALEREFVTKNDMALMGEQEILSLIFRPGFSTADNVTDISGRGVGMDVVKTNIEKLGGKIELFTTLGKGTTFRLLLPLTLAIIPSLIVEVEGQKFALPQINVQEIVRIKANDPARRIEYINDAEVLRLRGRLLPIVHLADVLGIERTFIDPRTGERRKEKRKYLFDVRRGMDNEEIIENAKASKERRYYNQNNIVRILHIRIGSKRLGISVDTIYGGEEILVKTLPVYVKDSKCYSGVTILGDGKAALILDPIGIIEKANLHYTEIQENVKSKQLEKEIQNMREKQNLLLIKCSGDETLAIDMSLVSRVEEIRQNDIERIGDKEFIKFRGESLRVIRPEDYLPINKQESNSDKLFVIIPKLVKHPLGIVIEKLYDTVQTSIDINQEESIKSKGIIGSTILNNKIVLLVNVYELFELACPEHYVIEAGSPQTADITILLVEDTPFFQRIESSYLENAGYRVVLAQDGKEALEILDKRKIDFVISDISMPRMDGIEMIRQIRNDERYSRLPVIALTSLTGEKQKKEGLEAGFDAYEFKLDRYKLIELVNRMVREKVISL